MRLILHVGLPKTASTAIQVFAFNNSSILAAKENLWYPTDRIGKHRHHAILSCALIGPIDELGKYRGVVVPDAREYLAKAVSDAAANNCHTVLLSSELFNRATLPETHIKHEGCGSVADLELLKEFFSEIDIAMYVRRQDEWLESYYNQLVKDPYHGCKATIHGEYERLKLAGRLDYFQQAERWAEVFGIEHVVILPFEREQIEISPVVHFFNQFGVDVTGNEYEPIRISNKSLSVNSTSLLMRLFQQDIALLRDHDERFKLVQRFVKFESFAGYDCTYTKFMSYDLANEILGNVYDSNAMLARKYLNRADGTLFTNTVVKSDGRYEGGPLYTSDDIQRLYNAGVFAGMHKKVAEMNLASDAAQCMSLRWKLANRYAPLLRRMFKL